MFRTHTSGEELDRFSGYSEEPEPYHPPLHGAVAVAAGHAHQRRRHPAQHQPNPRWDRIPSGYVEEEDPGKAGPRYAMNRNGPIDLSAILASKASIAIAY